MYKLFCSCLCYTCLFLGVSYLGGCILALAEILLDKFHRKD